MIGPLAGASRGRRAVLWVVAAIVCIGVILTVWGAIAASRVVGALRIVEREQTVVTDAVAAGDTPAARRAARELEAGASRASGSAEQLPLRIATWLPFVGDDVDAVQRTSAAADVLARDAITPLVDVADTMVTATTATPGVLPVNELRTATPAIVTAADAVSEAAALLAPVETTGLVGPLRTRVSDVRDRVNELDSVTRGLADAAPLLPGALGADGPRQYLVAFQNLAEARPTGGIIGAWALLEVDAGRVSLSEVGANDDLESLAAENLPDLPDEVTALYGADLRLSQNVNLSPQFPQAAQLLSSLWQQQGRPAPDAVLSLDPVVLADLMDPGQSVEVAGGPALTSENLVRVLLSDVYTQFDGDTEGRLEYLTSATAAVFGATVGAGLDPLRDGRSLAAGFDRGHAILWSADEQEQAQLVALDAAGALPSPELDATGVFLTNADGSKLDYYLTMSARTAAGCRGEAPVVRLELSNSVPETIPSYVGNQLDDGATPRRHVVILSMFVPAGRGIDRLLIDGEPVGFDTGSEAGWSVIRATIAVDPGEPTVVTAELTGTGSAPTRLLTQPLISETAGVGQDGEVVGGFDCR